MALLVLAGCGTMDSLLLPGGTFSSGPSDVIPRYFHNASRLDDGRVVITGGLTARVIPPTLIPADTIATFNPATNRISAGIETTAAAKGVSANQISARLQIARSSHTQTMITRDRILVTGGNTRADNNQPGTPTATCEVIDAQTGDVSFGPTMSETRVYHSATPIAPTSAAMRVDVADGEAASIAAERVLIAGGSSWQVFDAESELLTAPVPLARRRSRHAAVAIPGDDASAGTRVLIIGGAEAGDTLEILDPVARTSTLLDVRLPVGVFDLAAIRLAGGQVLIFGGQRAGSGETTNQTAVFDPVGTTLILLDPPPGLEDGMGDHRMVRVGRYVVAFGGEQQIGKTDTELRKALVFDGDSMSWVNEIDMLHPHDDFPAVPLLDGRVLLIGGGTGVLGVEAPTAESEIFAPRFSDGG